MPTTDAVCRALDAFAPPHLAADWDNTGLLLGDGATEVRRVLCCLTLTEDVAEEAIAGNVQLVVAHHPLPFKPIKNLSTKNAEGRLLWLLARAGIAIYSPHTRFDNADGGINNWIARQFGLQSIRPLRIASRSDSSKIVAFVPESDLEKVAEALFAAGAGRIGEYSECSFRQEGTGTFRGSSESNPTVGRKGELESVPEIRLEVLCPNRALPEAVAALRRSHSYEEPAYDIYPVQTLDGRGGAGRIGSSAEPRRFADIIADAKRIFAVPTLQVVGEAERPISKVAIACGAAGEFLADALRQRADLFITGEMRFHDLLTARREGIAVLMPGHYASERPAVEYLAEWLGAQFAGIRVGSSLKERDPLQFA